MTVEPNAPSAETRTEAPEGAASAVEEAQLRALVEIQEELNYFEKLMRTAKSSKDAQIYKTKKHALVAKLGVLLGLN